MQFLSYNKRVHLIQSWCDVQTDSGGFLLIGVKNTPETWAIPSKASFIHPRGKPMWSSAFGDREVLDFRVQISTTKDFHDTRAHWYKNFCCKRCFWLSRLQLLSFQFFFIVSGSTFPCCYCYSCFMATIVQPIIFLGITVLNLRVFFPNCSCLIEEVAVIYTQELVMLPTLKI